MKILDVKHDLVTCGVHIITCRALSTARCDRWAILGPLDCLDRADYPDGRVY